MASITGKSGKCSNFGNCSIADTRKLVEVPVGIDFVCSECQKPLLLNNEGASSGSSKAPIIGVFLVTLLLGGGGAWYFFSGDKKPEKSIPEPAVVIQEPQTKAIPKSASGDCSAADKRDGLCR